MISRLEIFYRRWRRRFSRSEWLFRLLQLPPTLDSELSPGLVLIQIDGLAHQQLEQAMANGEMPFLSKLIASEHYRLYRQYAGVPTTTPAYQAELFYGVKTAVPGFGFFHRGLKRLVRMYEPAAAAEIEQSLNAHAANEDERHRPLLRGGSCYVDCYSAGAEEPHFCPSSLGWGSSLRERHLLVKLVFLLINSLSLVRALLLMLIELFLAIVDFARGLIAGKDFFSELKFIPTRALVAILLRELVTVGVKIDVARGLPVIHVNYLGYDEQAHRRGPSSKFAHWTLKGIDGVIRAIWKAINRSGRRDYELWVYSDHGQEDVTPYQTLHGRSFTEAVLEVFSKHQGRSLSYRASGQSGVELLRANLLGGKLFGKKLFDNSEAQSSNQAEHASQNIDLHIASLGPLAHLYYHHKLTDNAAAEIARSLLNCAKVPMVLRKASAEQIQTDSAVYAWTADGEFRLPRDRVKLLGKDHPYLEEIAQDLVALCQHEHAGEFVVCGWRAGLEVAVSFAMENGAHAGVGSVESSAFALLPADIPLLPKGKNYLRALDLRKAALGFLDQHRAHGQLPSKNLRSKKPPPKEARVLRLMTYNTHSCIGMDGTISPTRIARVISRYQPDVVALQELDVDRDRTENVDQADIIAEYLQMEYSFHPSFYIEEGLYGNAILSRFPLELIKAEVLPALQARPQAEPRGALWASINFQGIDVQVINTHLGLNKQERRGQVDALLGENWLASSRSKTPTILCGDFNLLPSSPAYQKLSSRLRDAQCELMDHQPKMTFSGRFPSARIDHVFIDQTIKVVRVETPSTELIRVASDHLPLVVDLLLPW